MKKDNKNNKKKWIIIFIIAVILILAVVLALVLGNNKDNNGGTTSTTEVATVLDASATTTATSIEESTVYWLLTDKKSGVTVDTEGWTDAKDYNGVSWANATTKNKPYVWSYMVDSDGNITMQPTLWYEYKEEPTTTEQAASANKPDSEDPDPDIDNSGTNPPSNSNGNGGNNNGSTGSSVTPSGNSNAGNTGGSSNSGSNGGNSGNSGSTGNNSGPSGNNDSTTAATTQAPTTQAPAVCPPHDYVYIVEEEKGEYQEVVVQEGYYKDVIVGYFEQCNGCGMNIQDLSAQERTRHCLGCTDNGTSSHQEPIWGTEWIEPVTELRWVVTEPAKYYFQCSMCGKISSSRNPNN